MANLSKGIKVGIIGVAAVAIVAGMSACMLFGGGEKEDGGDEQQQVSNVENQNTGNYIVFNDAPKNTVTTNSLAPMDENRGLLTNVSNIANAVSVSHVPPPPSANGEQVDISNNIADGEIGINGVKVKLGETTLNQLLVDSGVEYSRLYDVEYGNGAGRKVSKKDAAEHMKLNQVLPRKPRYVYVIWRDDDLNTDGNWMKLTIWNPNMEDDQYMEMGKCKIIAVQANNLQFDAITNESTYYQLPGGVDSNTKANGMSSFINAWGDTKAFDSSCISYIFWDGYFWTWGGEHGAFLGIHVDQPEHPTMAYGFEYTLPWCYAPIDERGRNWGFFVEGDEVEDPIPY